MPAFTKTTTHKTATPTTPLFWLFTQNNSGGYWKSELPSFLFIEAYTPEHANTIAEDDLGVDFDDRNDFSGSRWSPCNAAYDEGMETPTIFGVDIEMYITEMKYTQHPYAVAIVRLSGETTHYRLT